MTVHKYSLLYSTLNTLITPDVISIERTEIDKWLFYNRFQSDKWGPSIYLFIQTDPFEMPSQSLLWLVKKVPSRFLKLIALTKNCIA